VVSIREVRPAFASEWDSLWAACEYSTFFHSRAWAELWQSYTNAHIQPASRLVVFDDGREALLPLSVEYVCGGLVSLFLSSPQGTFGGWLSRDQLSPLHGRALEVYLKSLPGLFWRINPYDPIISSVDVTDAHPDETHVIDLNGRLDTIIRAWSKGARDAVRQSERAGVTVRRATEAADWTEYYQVYEDSLQRWGNRATSRYEPKLFDLLSKLDSPCVSLWLAEHDKRIVAGVLCFSARDHVVCWHGAALKAAFRLRPVNLLYFRLISHFCERGFRWFDLNPSGGHETVTAWKRGLGAAARSASYFVIRSRPAKLGILAQNLHAKSIRALHRLRRPQS
jgi:hypothetical protein